MNIFSKENIYSISDSTELTPVLKLRALTRKYLRAQLEYIIEIDLQTKRRFTENHRQRIIYREWLLTLQNNN